MISDAFIKIAALAFVLFAGGLSIFAIGKISEIEKSGGKFIDTFKYIILILLSMFIGYSDIIIFEAIEAIIV